MQVQDRLETHNPTGVKRQRGRVSYLRGAAAEDQVARRYSRSGARLLSQRWRGKSGEIDLIFAHGNDIICVEVKASKTHAQAAESLRPRQIARLREAAEEFLGTQPRGALTPMRFDVALVDGQGQIEILENALMAC
jgi:putative endonuclease